MVYSIIKTDTVFVFQNAVFSLPKEEPFFSLTFNDVLTLLFTFLSILFAIWQFSKQMKENTQAQITANQKNWYLTVVVVPQLQGLDMFYDGLISNMRSYVQSFSELDDSNKLLHLSQKQADIKEEINSFFDQLQALVKSYDMTLSQQIADSVMDLEDCTTVMLSDTCFEIDSFNANEIRRKILLNKSKIISILYSAIK